MVRTMVGNNILRAIFPCNDEIFLHIGSTIDFTKDKKVFAINIC